MPDSTEMNSMSRVSLLTFPKKSHDTFSLSPLGAQSDVPYFCDLFLKRKIRLDIGQVLKL